MIRHEQWSLIPSEQLPITNLFRDERNGEHVASFATHFIGLAGRSSYNVSLPLL